MPEQDERPRPHGDPLNEVGDSSDEVVDTADTNEELVNRNAGLGESNPDEHRSQADSDASPDASGEPRGDRLNNSDRADGRGSDANGIPAFDEADGDTRKKLYRDGAVLVSRID